MVDQERAAGEICLMVNGGVIWRWRIRGSLAQIGALPEAFGATSTSLEEARGFVGYRGDQCQVRNAQLRGGWLEV